MTKNDKRKQKNKEINKIKTNESKSIIFKEVPICNMKSKNEERGGFWIKDRGIARLFTME